MQFLQIVVDDEVGLVILDVLELERIDLWKYVMQQIEVLAFTVLLDELSH